MPVKVYFNEEIRLTYFLLSQKEIEHAQPELEVQLSGCFVLSNVPATQEDL